MREQLLDIDIAIARHDIQAAGGFEAQMPHLIRWARAVADERAAQVEGTVRPTIDPHIIVSEAIDPIRGDVFLIATRWVCDVPEAAPTTAQR